MHHFGRQQEGSSLSMQASVAPGIRSPLSLRHVPARGSQHMYGRTRTPDAWSGPMRSSVLQAMAAQAASTQQVSAPSPPVRPS